MREFKKDDIVLCYFEFWNRLEIGMVRAIEGTDTYRVYARLWPEIVLPNFLFHGENLYYIGRL